MLLCGNLSDLLFAGMPRFIVPRTASSLPALKAPLEEFYNCTQSGRLPASLLGRLLTKAYFRSMPLPPPRVLGVTAEVELARFDLSHPEPLNKLLLEGLHGQPNPNATYERLYANGGIDYNSPFYDLDVVDFAFSVPDRMKIQGREQKHILREAAKGLLPEAILRRPKGLLRLARDRRFSDVLAGMAAEYLSSGRVRERGLFEPGDVARIRRRPTGGVYPEDQLYRLWTLLLTEIWSGLYIDHRGAAPMTGRTVLADAA